MYGIGIAEQVVHISQNFLVSPHQEHTDIIRFLCLDGMYRQVVCHITAGHEVGNLPIRVASNILQGSRAVRTFIQTLNRHDGENLVNRPGIRQRLEQREVTEIFVSQQLVQITELIRCMLQTRCNLVNLTCNRPVHTFNLCTCLQIDNTVTEQVQRFFTNLLGIMPCLQHTALIQVIPNLIKFLYELMIVCTHLKVFVHRRQ